MMIVIFFKVLLREGSKPKSGVIQLSISSFVLFSVPSFFNLSKVELANTSKPKPIFFIGVATWVFTFVARTNKE